MYSTVQPLSLTGFIVGQFDWTNRGDWIQA